MPVPVVRPHGAGNGKRNKGCGQKKQRNFTHDAPYSLLC
jgi:hypothetical protein